jgi:putative hydrolase
MKIRFAYSSRFPKGHKHMNFILDIHCHTISCGHAYSTVREIAAQAAKIGLQLVGISDHGPELPGSCHSYHFANLRVIDKEIYGVRILKGAEANIMDDKGTIDLPEWVLQRLDFVIASLHTDCVPPNEFDYNTNVLLRAMENPYVSIIGHPGDARYPIDMEAVVKTAKRTKTILEVNNLSLKPNSHRYGGDDNLRQMLALCKELGVPVIASSDAHVDSDVGNLTYANQLITESGICESLVLNTDMDLLYKTLAEKAAK